MINAIGSTEGISLSNFDNLVTQYTVSQVSHNINDKQSSNNEYQDQKSLDKNKSIENKVNYTELSNSIKTILNDNKLAIEFTRDKETKEMVMKIINDDTKEVIRQYPAEISLKIARLIASNLESGNITNAVV